MEDIVKEFLTVKGRIGYGYGSSTGFGFGFGAGNDYGSGSGSGYSDGHGSVNGDGFGDGYGSGNYYVSGYGYGSGSASGYCDASGSGSGSYVNGIKTFNGDRVYNVDNIQTIFRKIKRNIATGYILNADFTLNKCYIVKGDGHFAHGKTLKEAVRSLNEKKWESLDTDEVIAEFCKKFKKGEFYKGSEFFEWHHHLTGSCLMGRESFVKNNGLNMGDDFTVDDFIQLTENEYGSSIIKKLKQRYK